MHPSPAMGISFNLVMEKWVRLPMMSKRHAAAACAALAVTVWVGTSFAAVSDDRQAAMKDVLASFKVLVGISKSGQFDAAEASKRGTAIAADLDKFKDLFPEGSQNADDKALPQIWSDRAGFEQHRMDARNAALAIAASTDMASFKTAFKSLGASCDACHEKYRAKEQ